MTRIVGSLLGLLLLVGVVVAPALVYGAEDGGDGYEPTSISSYDVAMTVRDDGTAQVRETIVLQVSTSDRRGIFRFFDRADSPVDGGRIRPRDVEITRDGAEEPWVTESSGAGRYLVWRIGDEDVFLTPGAHTYRLTYELADVLAEAPDGSARLSWDVVPGGWAQAIQRARIRVELPAGTVGDVACDQGQGLVGGCTATGGQGGGDTLSVVTGPLAPRTPVTLTADLALDAPAPQEALPWAPRWDPVLGTRPWLLVLVVLVALGALALGALLARRSRELRPGLPLTYAPPDGLGPAQAYFVAHEQVGRERFVATLLHAAERGAVRLLPHDDGWTVFRDGTDAEATLDPVTMQAVSLVPRGGSFTFRKKDVSAGRILKAHLDAFEDAVRDWGRDSGTVVRAGLGGAGGLLVIAAGVAAVAVAWFAPGPSVLGLVPGGFAATAVPLLLPGSGTRRTSSGRALWSAVGGFERVLSTPSSKQRFDFSGRRDLYTAYVPWAVAFDCAKEWASKYRFEVGEDPPAPSWAGWYAGSSGAAWTDRIAHDLDASIDSAISAYDATQSSSSSGGGGGGGGGGGSW